MGRFGNTCRLLAATTVLAVAGLAVGDETVEAAAVEAVERPPAKLLTPHSAEYKVKISVLSGELRTRLMATTQGYVAVHRIEPSGMAKIFTNGTIEETAGFSPYESGVLPVTYVSNDSITKDKTRADIRFDWETGAVTGTVDDEPIEDILDELAHDRVSIQYELMVNLLNGGLSEQYILFDIDRLKTLNVSVVGTQEVKVPAGRFEAIGIQHQAEGSSRVTTLWCVEELDYLPVIIEQHRKGKLRMRAELKSYAPELPESPDPS
ncbi:MAG: DUF3108 domain-containing protein [Woeseiaceae bacterium]|nr:DUF3108 domain-containing protein [Woeseiaceae bacterium]